MRYSPFDKPIHSHFFDDAPINIEAFVEVKLYGFEQCGSFELLSPGNDFVEGHAWLHGKTVLGDNGAFVEIHRNEMSGDTDNFDALLVGLTIGLWSRKTGKQGRMNVDDVVFVAPNEIG